MMESELQNLIIKLSSTTSSRSNCPSPQDQEAVFDEYEHRYTSLKDIILDSPPSNLALSYDQSYYHEFDPSNIMIRNQLVKHAASVYVQSATILVNRNQNWVSRFWEQVKIRVSSFSCWNCYYFCDPLRACFLAIYYSVGGALNRMMIIRE
ncbi:uncharacterized protein LOC126682960 [Mercurialis annua]|uniref:uncharacterized protein LOC126682960 n=1 Tax=Mercurialis annua TaxID=3986 RepID=UPI00215EE654|nr:uncharacterized protein LOC126682960 [Mercurialis annua]